MRLNDLIQPTTYELVNRAVGLGMLLGTAAITVNSFNLLSNPTAHVISNVLALCTGSTALWTLSQANTEAGARRDRETIASQALRDGQYTGMKQAVDYSYQLPAGVVPKGVQLEKSNEVVKLGNHDPIQLMLDSDKHILLSAPTRTGKTSVLLAYIKSLYQKYGAGNFDLLILDPKDTIWLGLERVNEPKIVRYVGSELSTQELCDVVQWVRDRLDKRIKDSQQNLRGLLSEVVDSVSDAINLDKVKSGKNRKLKFKPFFIVFDEYTSSYDTVMTEMEKTTYMRFKNNVKMIASKGAGLGVYLILVGQSPQISEVGFSNNMRSSFDVFCLGSPRGYGAIEKAISDRWLVPASSQQELKDQWQKIKSEHPRSYVFFTTAINNTFGLTPDLSSIESSPLYQTIPVPADKHPQTSGSTLNREELGTAPGFGNRFDHVYDIHDRKSQLNQGFQPILPPGSENGDRKLYGLDESGTTRTNCANLPQTQLHQQVQSTSSISAHDRVEPGRTTARTIIELDLNQQATANSLSVEAQSLLQIILNSSEETLRRYVESFRKQSKTKVIEGNWKLTLHKDRDGQRLYKLVQEIFDTYFPE